MRSGLLEKKGKTMRQPVKRSGIASAIEDLKEELKKVSWTTKEELISYTKTVLLSMFAFGMGIYIVDILIKGALEGIKTAVRFMFGS